jgi:hypothetical protein
LKQEKGLSYPATYKKEKVNKGKIIHKLVYGTQGFNAVLTTDHFRQLTELL